MGALWPSWLVTCWSQSDALHLLCWHCLSHPSSPLQTRPTPAGTPPKILPPCHTQWGLLSPSEWWLPCYTAQPTPVPSAPREQLMPWGGVELTPHTSMPAQGTAGPLWQPCKNKPHPAAHCSSCGPA